MIFYESFAKMPSPSPPDNRGGGFWQTVHISFSSVTWSCKSSDNFKCKGVLRISAWLVDRLEVIHANLLQPIMDFSLLNFSNVFNTCRSVYKVLYNNNAIWILICIGCDRRYH